MVGFKQRLAERIIEARESQGWDQRELAFRADVSDKTIARLEQAKVAAPRGSTLRKIADATGRRVEDLRPDMDTEERDLRAQLDRIEAGVNDVLDRLSAESATEVPDRLPDEQDPSPDAQDADEPETASEAHSRQA